MFEKEKSARTNYSEKIRKMQDTTRDFYLDDDKTQITN